MGSIKDTVTDNTIEFDSTIHKVQTLADGGIRLTLDLPESAFDVARDMMHIRHTGAVLRVAAVGIRPDLQNMNRDAKISTRSEWEPKGAT